MGKSRFLTTLSTAVLIFSFIILAHPVKTSAAVDTCTWTGATSANWSTGSNWTGCDNGGVPQDGDSLVFPSGASNLTMNNDLLITVADVTFSGDGYSLGGNSLHLSGSLNMYGASTIATSLAFISSTASNRTLNYQNPGAILPSTVSLSLTGGANLQLFSTVSSLPMPRFAGIVNNLSVVGAASGSQRAFIAGNAWSVTVSGTLTLARATVLCQQSDCLGVGNHIAIANGNSQGAELNLFSDNVILDNDISLNSNGFDGPPTLSVSGANAELRGNVSVDSTANFRIDSGRTLLLGNGSGTLNIASGATAVMLGTAGEAITVQDQITGSGVLNVVDSHVTSTANNATYAGNIVVDAGGTFTGDGSAIGTGGGVTNVNDGGSWTLTNSADTAIGDRVTLEGAGNNTVNAALDAQGQAVTFNDDLTTLNGVINQTSSAGKAVTFADTINGTGDLTLERTSGSVNNSYVVSPAVDDSFTGDLRVIGAKTTLSGTALSVPHNLDIQANIGYDAQVIVSSAGQLSTTSAVNLTNGTAKTAYFTVNTPTVNVGDVTGNGTVNFLSTGQNLRVGNGDTSSTFTGTLAGSGNTITKVGSGTWTLGTGASVAAGNAPSIVIEGGVVSFNSSLVAPITVASGSTLKGSGTIGAATVQSGATINVGNSPGCMTMSSLSLASGATFTEEIAGNTACTTYDQTTVTGTANLNNATLNVALSYTPTPGTSFTILKAGSVLGTFNGLPEGANVTANGVTMKIHYTTTAVTLEYAAGSVPAGSLANTGLPLAMIGGAAAGIVGLAVAIRFTRQRKLYRLR